MVAEQGRIQDFGKGETSVIPVKFKIFSFPVDFFLKGGGGGVLTPLTTSPDPPLGNHR